MFNTREEIFTALFTLLKGIKGVKTCSRRFTTFDNISQSSMMPYLILCTPKETYPQRAISALPAKRTFQSEIIVWFATGQNQDKNYFPDTFINNFMDSLDEILAPIPPRDTQTLGGLVDHCYIKGDITRVPGDLDGLGMIHIPLEIVVP